MNYKLELEKAYKLICEKTDYLIYEKFVQNESVNSKLSHWNIHKAMNDRVFNIENFKQRLNIIDRLLYDPETCKLPTQAFKDAVELV